MLFTKVDLWILMFTEQNYILHLSTIKTRNYFGKLISSRPLKIEQNTWTNFLVEAFPSQEYICA